CFVAVRGMRGDGHSYLRDAIERGAAALLVERARLDAAEAAGTGILEHARRAGAAVLAVDDTREALRAYAGYILAKWAPTVIGVSGSTGKTTTKEAIATVLATRAPTFRSWRNYNDLLGLPLSLGRLEPAQRYAVLEMGADHPGEIAALCALLKPTIGVVTNVSPVHLQYFGDVGALADEYGALIESLPPDGAAVLNGADSVVRGMSAQTRAPAYYFGLAAEARTPLNVLYGCVPLGTREPVCLALRPLDPAQHDAVPIVFPHLHGDHWAYTILAAATVGRALGVSEQDAFDALRDLAPLPGRMRWLDGSASMVLLDDSHNAAPASVAAGLATLEAIGRARGAQRIAVLGDMLRLGAAERDEHRCAGERAAATTDYLVTLGTRAEAIAEAAREVGMSRERIAVTHTADDAARAVQEFAGSLDKPPVVYLKGSEELRVEQVTARLMAHPERAEQLLDRQTQAWQRVMVMRPDRPTWLEIDLSAIGHNTQLIAERVGPDTGVLVSLKADAYGHGALRVARTVLRNGASWLGVATVSEAAPLRAAGISAPILVFGYIAPWQAREAVRLDLRATVYSLDAARTLAQAAQDLGRELRVHVKVDTGMARLGLRAEDVDGIVTFCRALRELPGLVMEGAFTHLATADSADQTYSRRQLARFETVLAALQAEGLRPPIVHVANSAAALALPEARYDLVRPGIAIYGLNPSDEVPLPEGFAPALAFKTQVAQVKEVPAGEGISYGATYITTAPTRIAVLPVGYADGFRRAPANWGDVLVRGRRAPILGRVCMDQCMVDVTAIPGVQPGDEVVLIGRQGEDELTADEVARRLGTISYEVVAELLARVPRVS
ncbi:MAG TPA: alanine racemase, partial [Ktedonobacterales bacterium]|nr:alanine racemase [Ktedonobacterales bacterium]